MGSQGQPTREAMNPGRAVPDATARTAALLFFSRQKHAFFQQRPEVER